MSFLLLRPYYEPMCPPPQIGRHGEIARERKTAPFGAAPSHPLNGRKPIELMRCRQGKFHLGTNWAAHSEVEGVSRPVTMALPTRNGCITSAIAQPPPGTLQMALASHSASYRALLSKRSFGERWAALQYPIELIASFLRLGCDVKIVAELYKSPV